MFVIDGFWKAGQRSRTAVYRPGDQMGPFPRIFRPCLPTQTPQIGRRWTKGAMDAANCHQFR